MPDNPGAWLMAIGQRRAIDGFRRAATFERKREELAFARDAAEAAGDDAVGDDLLSLMFTCCHPVLSTQRGSR